MKELKSALPKALMIFIIMTLVCGVLYTGAVTIAAQLIASEKANGSIIEIDGRKYGSELLGQQFNDDSHMWGRIMIIDKCTDGRFLGVFGEKTVNVLKFNLMLDGIMEQ